MFFSLTNPNYLYFLFAVPVLIILHFFLLRRSRGKALKFANFTAISKIKGVDIFSKNIFTLVFSILICCLIVLSLAGFTIHVPLQSSKLSYVIAIDSSQSMTATDVLPNRLSAAKNAAEDFVKSSPIDTEFGVVSFSGNSLIEQSMSDNKGLLNSKIDNIQINTISGTDLYEAVVTSTNLLQDQKYKAIVLMSDGQINVGTIQKAIDYAKNHDVVVNTIAVGTAEGGETDYGISKVDTDSMKALAFGTNGHYFLAENESSLENSFNSILETEEGIVPIDLSPYFLIASFCLVFIFFILENTRYRIFP